MSGLNSFFQRLEINNEEAVGRLVEGGYVGLDQLRKAPPSSNDLDNFGFTVFERNLILQEITVEKQEKTSLDLQLNFLKLDLQLSQLELQNNINVQMNNMNNQMTVRLTNIDNNMNNLAVHLTNIDNNMNNQLNNQAVRLTNMERNLKDISKKVDSSYEATCIGMVLNLVGTWGYEMASSAMNITVNNVEFDIVAKLRNIQNSIPPIPSSPMKLIRFPPILKGYFKDPTTILVAECTTGTKYNKKFNQLDNRVKAVQLYYNSNNVDILVVFFGQQLKGQLPFQLDQFTKTHVKPFQLLQNLYNQGKVKVFF